METVEGKLTVFPWIDWVKISRSCGRCEGAAVSLIVTDGTNLFTTKHSVKMNIAEGRVGLFHNNPLAQYFINICVLDLNRKVLFKDNDDSIEGSNDKWIVLIGQSSGPFSDYPIHRCGEMKNSQVMVMAVI